MIAQVFTVVAEAFEALEELAKNQTLKTAAEVAAGILRITGAVTKTVTGKVTADDGRTEIHEFLDRLRRNDLAAEAKLDAKFPPAKP